MALRGHAARAVAAANKTIRALIILAGVICGDETPLRVGPGPKIRKKYLQVACTNLLTYYYLGDRDLASFKDFIYSDLHGAVVVYDRYQNYNAFDQISHQLCCQHLLHPARSGEVRQFVRPRVYARSAVSRSARREDGAGCYGRSV